MELVAEIRNLTICFPKENQGREAGDSADGKAVNNVSFEIYAGEILALVGESGSGKSLSALSIPYLLSPKAEVYGEISLFEGAIKPISKNLFTGLLPLRGKEIGMIFQEPMNALNPVFTCGHQVMEAILTHNNMSRNEARQKTIDLFGEVELPHSSDILNRYPHQLSGGQLQRVMIAMALCNRPKLLIADEPTTALDVSIRAEILQLLQALQKKYCMSVLLISHDLNTVAKIADRVIVMRQGKIVEEGPTKEIFKHPQAIYTKRLFQSNVRGKQKGISLPEPDATEQTKAFCYLPPGKALIEVKNLVVTREHRQGLFSSKTKSMRVIDEVSFVIKEHEFTGLVGESGSGKSTLAKALLKLITPSSGNIYYQEQNLRNITGAKLRSLRKEIQIVFQNPYGALNPRLSIGKTLAEPLLYHGICQTQEEAHHRVRELLEDVHLEADVAKRYPNQFSGGQRQRICIARALALAPRLIIFDESVSALDISIQAQILNLISSLREKRGFSALFISHDIDVVYYLCDRIMVLNQGKIIETGTADQIYYHPNNPYTQHLISRNNN